MATKYPDGIDNTTSLPYITNGTSPMVAEDINRLRDAVVAVETELGIDPSGTFTTVAARVAANEQSISEYARSEFLVLSHDGYVSRERVFVPSADFVATDGGPGFSYDLDLADVVGIGTSTPNAGYSLTLDGDGSSRIGGVVLRDAGTDTFFIGSPAAGNTSDIVLSNPNSGYLGLESGGDITVDGAAVVVAATGAVEIQGASIDVDSAGPVTIGASASAVEVGAAGADTSVLGDLVVEENIDVTSGKITFSNDLSIGSYPAGFAGFGAPLPLPYSVADSVSSVIVNTQNEELLLTTNLSGIFGLNTDNWTLLGLDNGRAVATNKHGGSGGPTSPATMFSSVAPFGVVGTMVMGSADPDDGYGSAIESGENLAIAALGDTALLLANNSSGVARVKIGAVDGSGPASTDLWSTKYGDSSVHLTKIADFVHDGSAQIQVAVGGGEAAPEYSFSGDEDTGIYNKGPNEIGVAVGGAEKAAVDMDGVKVVDGAVGQPSYSFISDTNTGVFQASPGTLSVSADGLEVLRAVNSSSVKKVVIGPEEEDDDTASILAATSRPDGGTADSVGAHLYVRAGSGLGTGQGGSVILQVAPPNSVSGQSQNAFSNILMANSNSAAAPRYLGVDASVVTLNGPVANNTSVNIGTQASTSGVTKFINIGTGGLSGSTTEINIGVSNSARIELDSSAGDVYVESGDRIDTDSEYLSITANAINDQAFLVSAQNGGIKLEASTLMNLASADITIQSDSLTTNSVLKLAAHASTLGDKTVNIGTDGIGGNTIINIGSSAGSSSSTTINGDAGVTGVLQVLDRVETNEINDYSGSILISSPTIGIRGSTGTTTVNIASQATVSGQSKTVNIGTGAASGSSTTINIGSGTASSDVYVNGSTLQIDSNTAVLPSVPVRNGYDGLSSSEAYAFSGSVDTGVGRDSALRPSSGSAIRFSTDGESWYEYTATAQTNSGNSYLANIGNINMVLASSFYIEVSALGKRSDFPDLSPFMQKRVALVTCSNALVGGNLVFGVDDETDVFKLPTATTTDGIVFAVPAPGDPVLRVRVRSSTPAIPMNWQVHVKVMRIP